MGYLEDQYADMVLPRMSAGRRAIVDWGVRYVGYPYIWAGEWGFQTPVAAGVRRSAGPRVRLLGPVVVGPAAR